jgi:hypothetical protein
MRLWVYRSTIAALLLLLTGNSAQLIEITPDVFNKVRGLALQAKEKHHLA